MDGDVMIPIVAILMPTVLVPTILILRHIGRKREWEHAERMRALELGRPVPGGEAWPALTAIAIGGVVPVGSMFFAWLTSLTTHAREEVWACASFVGMAGVIGGSILAARLIGARGGASHPGHLADGKPAFDPDAYDVVGRRG